ncbi:MAG: aminotransferase class I/II-fold pyridoxal phosphate-dependent enzyme, partial [Aliifodinibius sp.]|nr:aminotransferase class I/II-fold pyridoxal phosphate-dependent enzyme [Fodinibius sp.]
MPIASLATEISSKTITLIAPSKTFNIAGLKASVAIITDSEIRKSFQQAMSGLVGWVNIFGIAAMKAAYTKCDAWLNELLIALDENRNYLYDRIETIPGLSMNKPQGTYLAWIKSSLDLGDQKPSDF